MRLDLSALTRDARTVDAEEAEQAGVLVPVIEREGAHYVLFTERADHMPTHAGEMSFPGGGREADDADLTETALREAREEVGIDPESVDLLGRLDDVPGPYGHVVRPVVGRVPDRDYRPTSAEVAQVVVLPVTALVEPTNYTTEERSHPDRGTARLPFFRVDGHTVWGLTGFILQELLAATTDWTPPEQ
ncbi:NUDIX hydrolase [Halorarius halobius]|uniref:NUDIX hydrolase n=1 Tax=Halorarius halobius TaxID=2962671 RepID=UPI0020CD9A6D|nr:CoA pyrophosphatase [Halorarius halobius]